MDSVLHSSVMCVAKELLNADAMDFNVCLSEPKKNNLRNNRKKLWENLMKKYEKNYEECRDGSFKFQKSVKVTALGHLKEIQNDVRETVSSYTVASCVSDNMHLKVEDVRSENLFTEAVGRTCSSVQVLCSDTNKVANSESDCSSKENKYNYSARVKLDVPSEVITTISNKTDMLADLELENECERNVNGQYDVSSKNTFSKTKNMGIKELHISDDKIIEVATDNKEFSNCTKNTNKFQNERMSRVQMVDSVLSEKHVIENNSDCGIFDMPGNTKKVSKFIQNINCSIETDRSNKSRYSTLYSESGNLLFKDKYKRIETVSGSSLSVFEVSRNCGKKSNCIEKGYSKLKNSSVINNSRLFIRSSLKKFKSNAQIVENEGICDTSRKHKEKANLTDYANELENVRICDTSRKHKEDMRSENLFTEAVGRTCSSVHVLCSNTNKVANSESDCSSKENKYNYSARVKLDVPSEVITTISNKTDMLADLELENECERNVNGQYDVSSKNTFSKTKNMGIKELHISDDKIIEVATDNKEFSNCTKNTNKFQNERMSRVQMVDSVLSEKHVIENNSDCGIFDMPGNTKKVSKFIQNINCSIETDRSNKSRYSTLYSESGNLLFKDKYKRIETVSGSSLSVFEVSRNCGKKSNCIEKGYSKLKNSSVINNSRPFIRSSLKKFKSNAQIVENEGICDTSRKHKEKANLTDCANELENVRICDTSRKHKEEANLTDCANELENVRICDTSRKHKEKANLTDYANELENVRICDTSRKHKEEANLTDCANELENVRICDTSRKHKEKANLTDYANELENVRICDTSRKHKEEANLTDYANELENVRTKKLKLCDTMFVRETKLSNENKVDTHKLSVTPKLKEKDNRDIYVIIRTPVQDNFQYKRKKRFKYSFCFPRK